MFAFINNLTNRITMYRLVLYYLMVLLAAAVVVSWIGLIPYNPLAILFSTLFITAVCVAVNMGFARIFSVPVNIESAYITALILALIITPININRPAQFFYLAVLAAVIAMASKYLLAIRKKHIFNPAALAVTAAIYTVSLGASWWVGTLSLAPVILLGGLVLVKKIQRFDLVLSFLLCAFVGIFITQPTDLGNIAPAIWITLVYSPMLFFAFVMLTEPLTTPSTRILRIIYGAGVGILFVPNIHIGWFYSSPELALLIGNIFSFAVSHKEKLILQLKTKTPAASSVYDFVFQAKRPLKFKPGQYLELTLAHKPTDSRGNRRYFTIASAPTEVEVRIGVKFYSKPSTFKQSLRDLNVGDTIIATQRAGDFTLPRNKEKKLAFIAGGIGITPFRSMVKYLVDTNEQRDIVLFYSTATPDDIAYKEVFDQAETQFGLKTLYTVTDPLLPSQLWQGQTGYLTADAIKQAAPDYLDRIFYLSGSRSMVDAFTKTLRQLGVKSWHIKKDFFPGFV